MTFSNLRQPLFAFVPRLPRKIFECQCKICEFSVNFAESYLEHEDKVLCVDIPCSVEPYDFSIIKDLLIEFPSGSLRESIYYVIRYPHEIRLLQRMGKEFSNVDDLKDSINGLSFSGDFLKFSHFDDVEIFTLNSPIQPSLDRETAHPSLENQIDVTTEKLSKIVLPSCSNQTFTHNVDRSFYNEKIKSCEVFVQFHSLSNHRSRGVKIFDQRLMLGEPPP